MSSSDNTDFPICHFSYKETLCPFNLQKIISCSNFFYKNRKTINEGDQIPLLQNQESNFSYSKELIKYFISICEGKTQLHDDPLFNDDNVYQLFELSRIYEIKFLEKKANEYILQNKERLILQEFINNKNNHDPNIPNELFISNLLEYIDVPLFISLPINTLNRILSKYRSDNPLPNEKNKNLEVKIKDFVLKCFDQYHDPIYSILFNYIDYKSFSKECLVKIHESFSDCFNFSYLENEVLYHLIYCNLEINTSNDQKSSVTEKKAYNVDEDDKNYEPELEELDKEIVTFKLPNIVKFPAVKRIPKSFFRSVKNITSVTIPDSVIEISKYAFYECESLVSVLFSPTSQLKLIGDAAFFDCRKLSNFQIPSSVTYIGKSAFFYCENIDIKIPVNLKIIEERAFYYCHNNIKSIEIPSSVKSIEGDAFYQCFALKKVILPESLESIKLQSFFNCSNLQTIVFPQSLKKIVIGEKAFMSCTSLKEINFLSPIELIAENAFSGCSSLETVIFSSDINTIKHCAFNECTKLKEIQFSSSPEKVEGNSFCKCSPSIILKFLSSVKSIKRNSFKEVLNVIEIQFFSDLESIEENAFRDCPSLQSIKSLSAKYIKPYSFYGCKSLKELQLKDVEYIELYAFYECSSIENIEFPSSLKVIGECSFYDCKIKKISFANPLNLESIEHSAFWHSSFEKVEIPASMRNKIEWYAFPQNKITLIP